AGQLRTDGIVDLEPAAVEQRARRWSQAQQPGRRSTQQRRSRAEDADAAVHLHREAVGQPLLTHISIPSVPGAHRLLPPTQSSTISVKMRSPSVAVAVVASPSTPTSLTADTPPRRIFGMSSANGAGLPVVSSS